AACVAWAWRSPWVLWLARLESGDLSLQVVVVRLEREGLGLDLDRLGRVSHSEVDLRKRIQDTGLLRRERDRPLGGRQRLREKHVAGRADPCEPVQARRVIEPAGERAAQRLPDALPLDPGEVLSAGLLVGGRVAEMGLREALRLENLEHTTELFDRLLVVLDPQVDVALPVFRVLRARADHEKRRRLHPALVPARGLPRIERGQEPCRELALRGEERPLHVRDHRFAREDVPLDGIAPSGAMAGPRGAVLPGVGGAPALDVHDADLAMRASR